jgi:hypothetical protein
MNFVSEKELLKQREENPDAGKYIVVKFRKDTSSFSFRQFRTFR